MADITVNAIEIMGFLAADPEMRYHEGKPFTFFTVITSETYTKDGKEITIKEAHDVSCWNGTAEAVAQYLHTGSFVRVTGKMHYEAFQKPLIINGKKPTMNGEPVMYWDHNAFIKAEKGGITFFPDFKKREVVAESESSAEDDTIELSGN